MLTGIAVQLKMKDKLASSQPKFPAKSKRRASQETRTHDSGARSFNAAYPHTYNKETFFGALETSQLTYCKIVCTWLFPSIP